MEESTPAVRDRAGLWNRIPRGLITISIGVLLLFLVSAVFAPSSVTKGPLLGMLPFAAVLAIVSLGQTLVVQQGGIDISIMGAVSLTVVIATHGADGDDSRVAPALFTALVVLVIAGLVNGFLVGRVGLNPIIATLGMNAVLYAIVLGYSGGIPQMNADLLSSMASGLTFGIPNAVFYAVAAVIVVTVAVKRTVPGRRFEAVGANPTAAWAAGLRVKNQQMSAYVWAMVLYWLGGVLLAGILKQPTAYQGDDYLLPSVAAVVLGGTSLLGGRGFPVATALGALFLSQLSNFVLGLGVSFAIRTIVEALALVIGVALYTLNWKGIRARMTDKNPSGSPPGGS
ncbi:MAG: ABC transporter permease [Marinovum sp.]|nr:ABC transporter permease [Marinovum sp.]